MSYQAMARRWRPQTFEEMVGQEHVAQTIRNALVHDRLAHAFLFTGTRGVGKTTSARILARMLNCQSDDLARRPCGACANCVEIAKGASMDVLEIDAASHTGVDDVRDLREQLKYAASGGRYRVVIYDEVHMLSKAAFNALLKILEEPPAHVVFILATTEIQKVPQTILSRVQRYDFRRLSPALVRDRLAHICQAEGIEADPEALEIVALRADGSMRDGLSLFDQVYAYSGKRITADAARSILGVPDHASHLRLLHALASHDPARAIGEFHGALARGVDPQDYVRGFGEFLRNALFARLPGLSETALAMLPERRAELSAATAALDEGDLLRWARMIGEATTQARDARDPRLVLEIAFARMAALDRVADLRAVLEGNAPPPMTRTAVPVAPIPPPPTPTVTSDVVLPVPAGPVSAAPSAPAQEAPAIAPAPPLSAAAAPSAPLASAVAPVLAAVAPAVPTAVPLDLARAASDRASGSAELVDIPPPPPEPANAISSFAPSSEPEPVSVSDAPEAPAPEAPAPSAVSAPPPAASALAEDPPVTPSVPPPAGSRDEDAPEDFTGPPPEDALAMDSLVASDSLASIGDESQSEPAQEAASDRRSLTLEQAFERDPALKKIFDLFDAAISDA